MSRIRFIFVVTAVAILTTACSGPFGFFSGGELQGDVSPTPTDWSFTDEVSTVQIETNPSEPYSVNIWALALDEALYIHAGANRATWVEHLESDPRLRVKIDEKIYELAASRVTDAGEFARFADAYEVKYGVRPRNENIAEIYLLKLAAR